MTDESTFAQLRAVERERDGVREELARQDATNEDLRATLAMRTRALAASQQDLTAMQDERDEALAELTGLRPLRPYVATLERALSIADAAHDRTRTELKAEAAHWRATAERHLVSLGDLAKSLATARYQNHLLSADLASARQERERGEPA